jgi:hypothetical protein
MAHLEDSVSSTTASSEFSGSYVKENAYDDSLATEWASAGDGASAWIQFNWAAPVTIREVYLTNRVGDVWGHPRFTFSDATYSDGGVPLLQGQDIVYALPHPVATTSLRISIAPDSPTSGTNTGFKEVEIRDTYTVTPSTDLTYPDHLDVSSTYPPSGGDYRRWRAVDGNIANAWASNGDGTGAWIQWEWLSSISIETIQLRDRATDRWGTPRFTFSDASTQDGGEAISDAGYTTYTFSPAKTTTSIRVTVLSGGSGSNRGIMEAILTGNVTPPAPPEGRILGPAVQMMG